MGSFKETEEEVEVRKEDQSNINQFGLCHKKLKEIQVERDELGRLRADIEDVQQELMLSDGVDGQEYLLSVGDAFVHVDEDFLNDYLETQDMQVSEKCASLVQQHDEVEHELKQLKSTLYARFGDSIMLEDN